MNRELRIAVNGRALDRRSPPLARLAAAHLVSSLAALDEFQVHLVATEPIWPDLFADPVSHVVSTPRRRLSSPVFDQLRFPNTAKQLGADLLLCVDVPAPISAPAPVVVWYGDGEIQASGDGFERRLQRALAVAGMRGAAAVLYAADTPVDAAGPRWASVPPCVPPDVVAGQEGTAPRPSGLPEAYVLAACEPPSALPLLLTAWTWVESSLGDLFALLLACPDAITRDASQRAADARGLGETVRAVVLNDAEWPAAFRQGAALLHAGERANAAALRWALAAGLPAAALSTTVSESILGPAGYLATRNDARALGAACLTLLVEEGVADDLRQRGLERAQSYQPANAVPAWAAALRRAAGAS
jgi:hypothetical protein